MTDPIAHATIKPDKLAAALERSRGQAPIEAHPSQNAAAIGLAAHKAAAAAGSTVSVNREMLQGLQTQLASLAVQVQQLLDATG